MRRRSSGDGELEAVALAPRVRAEQEAARAPAARGSRRSRGSSARSSSRPDARHAPSSATSCFGSKRATDRQRVARLAREQLDAERLQPVERVVELLDDRSRERLVCPQGTAPGGRRASDSASEAAREEHRAARPRALLVDDRRGAELAGRGRPRPGRPCRPRRHESAISVRTTACARRTRAGPARAARRRRRACSGASTKS